MLSNLKLLVVAGLLAALVGCQNQSSSPSGKEAGKVYDIKGKVVAVDAEKKTVTIDHEDIPGLMKAMKMEFKVEDEKFLAGLKGGRRRPREAQGGWRELRRHEP